MPPLESEDTWNLIRKGDNNPTIIHRNNWSLMRDLLNYQRRLCFTFSELYTINEFATILPVPCGSQCHHCRINNESNNGTHGVPKVVPKCKSFNLVERCNDTHLKILYDHKDENNISYLFYSDNEDDNSLLDSIPHFFPLGVFNLRIPDDWLNSQTLMINLNQITQNRFLPITPLSEILREDLSYLYNFPAITILDRNLAIFPNISKNDWQIVLCHQSIMQDEHRQLNTIKHNFKISNFWET
jgi:Fe-S cluster biosynthesis and repair protein YggX